MSSHLTGDPGGPSRRIPPPQANVPQQRWGMVGGGVSFHSDVVGQPSRKRQRRRSNSKDGGSDVSGKKQGCVSRGGTVEMISTLCSTRFSTRRRHTVATSLIDRLRHDWRCKEAAEVGGYGRCMITFQATLVSVRSAWAARSHRGRTGEEVRGKLYETKGVVLSNSVDYYREKKGSIQRFSWRLAQRLSDGAPVSLLNVPQAPLRANSRAKGHSSITAS